MAVSSQAPARKITTGRGGAGNIGAREESSTNANLETPHITAANYTTGRGGKGNMARNNPQDPSEARRAQDVAPIARRDSNSSTGSADGAKAGKLAGINTGRGGRGNVFRTASHGAETRPDLAKRGRSESAGDKVMGVLKRVSSRGSQRSVRSTGSGGSIRGRVSEEAIEE